MTYKRPWNADTKDIWCYSWGSCKYSSKKAYKILIGHTETSPLFYWMWASSNLGKHKFFFWLLLMDRINTRNLLRRKNMELENYNCVLCNSDCEETACICSLNATSVQPVGTPSPYARTQICHLQIWLLMPEHPLEVQSSERSLSQHAGSFG